MRENTWTSLKHFVPLRSTVPSAGRRNRFAKSRCWFYPVGRSTTICAASAQLPWDHVRFGLLRLRARRWSCI